MRCDQEQLQNILQKLKISDGKRSKYIEDVVEVQSIYFCERWVDFDIRSHAVSINVATKCKDSDEFDIHAVVRLPFPVIPKKDENGFVFLYADIYKHPIVANNYVNRNKLHDWFRSKVVHRTLIFTLTSGKVFEITYDRFEDIANGKYNYTIGLKGDLFDTSFDLVPAFKFTWAEWPLDVPPISAEVYSNWPWYAVPQIKWGCSGDERTFMVCAPDWEREATKDLKNFNNVLRIMKGVREAHVHDFPHLSSYMLKTVLLHQLERVDWEKDLDVLFLEMWSCLVDYLNSGNMDFFLTKGINIFDDMPYGALLICRISAELLLSEFKKYDSKWLDRTFNV